MAKKNTFDEEWCLISKLLIFRNEAKKSATKKQFYKFSISETNSIYEQIYKLCIKLISERDKQIIRLKNKLKEEQRINMGHLATINTLKSEKPQKNKRIRRCKNCGKIGHDARTCHLYRDLKETSSESSDDDIYMENIIYQGVMYQKNIETDEIYSNSECVGEWDIETRSIEWSHSKYKILHESNDLYIKS